MNQTNAVEILSQRANQDPRLQAAYIEEKRKYHIACKIRECRMQKKLTQKQLAKLIGTTQSVISRLENAEYTSHSLKILKKISEVTHEPLHAFFEEEMKVPSSVIIFDIPTIVRECPSFYCAPSQILPKRLYA